VAYVFSTSTPEWCLPARPGRVTRHCGFCEEVSKETRAD
jgi:hypothetical protein